MVQLNLSMPSDWGYKAAVLVFFLPKILHRSGALRAVKLLTRMSTIIVVSWFSKRLTSLEVVHNHQDILVSLFCPRQPSCNIHSNPFERCHHVIYFAFATTASLWSFLRSTCHIFFTSSLHCLYTWTNNISHFASVLTTLKCPPVRLACICWRTSSTQDLNSNSSKWWGWQLKFSQRQ